MTDTNVSQKMVKAVIYAVFDEKAGPLARTALPKSFSKQMVDDVTFKSMSVSSMSEGTPKSLAIIPYPTYNLKGLVKNVVFDHPKRRGGKGDCCLMLVFDEARDSIFYKHIKQFEKVFDTHAGRFAEAEQGEEKLVEERCHKLLVAFHDEITGLIAELSKAELPVSNTAFPEAGVDEAENKIRYKIIVVGDPEVGKTSMILNFTERAFRRVYLPTIGVNISEKTIRVRNKRVEFVLWDVAGQSKFQMMRTHFYEGAQALLLVFDLTRPDTLKSISNWHADVLKSHKGTLFVAMAGNKADLVVERKVGKEAANLAQQLGMRYLETSALTGVNILETFKHIGEQLLEMNKIV